MDEFIRLGDQTYKADTSMSWMIRYESAFQKDALSAVQVLLESKDELQIVEVLLEIFFALTERTPAIAEQLNELSEQIIPIVIRSIGSKTKIETKVQSTGKPMTVMQVLASGIKRGLTLRDTHELTFGMWLEYCSEFNLISGLTREHDTVTDATQADIDRFIKG